MKKCPYCAEEIQDDALVCRYCGRDLPAPGAMQKTKNQKTKIAKWLLAIALATSLCCCGLMGVAAIGGVHITPTSTTYSVGATVIYVTDTTMVTATRSYTDTPISVISTSESVTSSPVLTSTLSTASPSPTVAVLPTNTLVIVLPAPTTKTYPAGASAICNDGTYSFSAHRRGTCSHHGGVKVWLKNLPP